MITITIAQAALSKSGQTAGTPVPDEGHATWNGQRHTARSANGAGMAVARLLVAAGCPDQSWETRSPAGQRLTYGNHLHRLAKTTVTTQARFARWAECPACVFGAAQKGE